MGIVQADFEFVILRHAKYTLPTDGMSETCAICSRPCFMLLTRYQDIRVKPKRCLGCILKFPPKGIQFVYGAYLKQRPWITQRYHQWGLVAQTVTQDVWTCVHCKSTLRSPKLGIPSSRGCTQGVTVRHRRTFWAHNRIPSVRCPLCDRRATLLRVPRLLEERPSSKFFPWTCRACFLPS